MKEFVVNYLIRSRFLKTFLATSMFCFGAFNPDPRQYSSGTPFFVAVIICFFIFSSFFLFLRKLSLETGGKIEEIPLQMNPKIWFAMFQVIAWMSIAWGIGVLLRQIFVIGFFGLSIEDIIPILYGFSAFLGYFIGTKKRTIQS